jgi:hypothetical protein
VGTNNQQESVWTEAMELREGKEGKRESRKAAPLVNLTVFCLQVTVIKQNKRHDYEVLI